MLIFLTTENLLKTINSLVSVVHPVMPIVKATRLIAKDARKKQVDQLFTVSQSNHFMGGIDRMDQNIDNYRMGVPSKKWWWLVLLLQLIQVFTTRNSCTRRVTITVLLIIWDLPDAWCSFICRSMVPLLLFLVVQQRQSL